MQILRFYKICSKKLVEVLLKHIAQNINAIELEKVKRPYHGRIYRLKLVEF